ncbi:MAG TPA: DUF692 family protein [Anaerolineales bacterium]|nr:DUF692 family protein [Anaerolineales bacterium]
MKLAVNYSTQAAVLLRNSLIKIDFFKCPDWPDLILEAQQHAPVAVHFNLTAGNGRLHKTKWDQVKQLKGETNTPYVSLHLESSAKDFPGYSPEIISKEQARKIKDTINKDIESAMRFFSAEQIIIENVPYRGNFGKVLRTVVEPDTICEVLEETGVGLLLDISHARIAANFLGMHAYDYLSQLPTRHIKEMHFTGLHPYQGRLQDHLEALPEDWPVLDWVLEKIKSGMWSKPWLLAYEVGGVGEKFTWRTDGQALARDIPKLFQRVF